MDILQRYNVIQDNMAHSQRKSLFAQQVQLVAVSKGHESASILPLLEAGHRVFGENRVQEILGKWPVLREIYPDIKLHLIGSLQTNKVKEALAACDVIETIDRPALIDSIMKECAKASMRCREFLIQVNTGEEPQKGGVAPHELNALYRYAQEKNMPVNGLMCVPPSASNPAPHFALLHSMAKALNLPVLSMGMSGDYETAIRLGATSIRVGTAIFGERVYEQV